LDIRGFSASAQDKREVWTVPSPHGNPKSKALIWPLSLASRHEKAEKFAMNDTFSALLPIADMASNVYESTAWTL
jgi:hypothetical protein